LKVLCERIKTYNVFFVLTEKVTAVHICSIMSQNENHIVWHRNASEDVSSLHVALCMLSFKKNSLFATLSPWNFQ